LQKTHCVRHPVIVVGSFVKLKCPSAKYSFFYMALLKKRPIKETNASREPTNHSRIILLVWKNVHGTKSVWQTHTHPPLTHTHICLALTYTPTIGCLKLQVSFRKRATNYRALLQKMTSKDKVSYGSWPPCSTGLEKFYFVRHSAGQFIEICENSGRVGKINVEK